MRLKEAIDKRILILDGAMGTMLQMQDLNEDDFRGNDFIGHPYSLKGLNDLLNITKPSVVQEIYNKYLDAGADIITANTFNANYYSLKDYGLEQHVYDINYKAIELAKKAANHYTNNNFDKPRFVAGTVGPTGKTASMSPSIDNPAYRDVSFDSLVDIYSLQAKGMIDAGVDILMVETVFDTLNAKAALYAINKIRTESLKDIPVMVSVTIDESGRNLSGQTVEAFYNSLYPFSIFSIGLNCSFGADKMVPYLEQLSRISESYVSSHPNAGLPNELGNYDQSPDKMAGLIEKFCEKGLVNIVGGCCGSKPEHIKAIASVAAEYSPRKIEQRNKETRLSGLQAFNVNDKSEYVKIGEKTNVAGSKKFARLVKEEKYEEALEIAAGQIRDGAQMLDINLDESMIDVKKVVIDFFNHLSAEPGIADVPVMIDSSDFDVINNGIKCLQGRSLVNSISLKDGEVIFKEKAKNIKDLGAVLVVMAFDEKGQADSFERKTEICHRAYNILTKEIDYQPEDIVFDPNVLTIGTGIEEHNNYAVDFIKSVKWIKDNLPYAKVIAGVSNVSFSFRGNNYLRDVINSVFLHYCNKAGLDFAIVNPSHIINYSEIPEEIITPVEDIVLNRNKDATDQLVNIAVEYVETNNKQEQKDEWREQSPEKRIEHAFCNGITNYIEEDIKSLKSKYDKSLDIIQGPLMDAMNKVGELFGAGKMFLPQVIKSARIMNKSVDLLIHDVKRESRGGSEGTQKKLLLATVEGDVHDIGKNIVALIFRCNNYEVVDMGVMVPNEDIIKAVEQNKPDIVGLSGLISPSLDKMIDVVKGLEEKKLEVPVLLGGAATSAIHTAAKVAPNYSGPVAHVMDATQCIPITNKLIGSDKEIGISNIKDKQKEIRDNLNDKHSVKKTLSLEEARKRKYQIKDKKPVKPKLLGTKEFNEFDFDIDQLEKYIDWSPFFHGWGLKGKYPSILQKEHIGKEAEKLFKEAKTMLEDFKKNNIIKPKGVIGIFPANSKNDDIIVYKDDDRKEIIKKIPMLRQQEVKDENGYTLSLADFLASSESGIKDYIGGFAVTTGIGVEKYIDEYKENNNGYESIMFRLLTDRMVEAAAEFMHEKVRTEYWGYDPDENMSAEDLFNNKYKGIRPAIGYPTCPEHSLKKQLFELLNAEQITGISLTEIYAMNPASSVSGFYFANNEAKFFGVGKIGEDQLIDYANRSGLGIEETKKMLYFAIENI